MSRTDLTSDAFTIIRNAIALKEPEVTVPFSNLLVKICDILKRENYIDNYKETEGVTIRHIKIYLRYTGKRCAITKIQKVSKPGRRVYACKHEVRSVLRGYGLGIVTTSSGVYSDREARERGLGGEVLGMVW
jgi:small subunit ribosomal protein S8